MSPADPVRVLIVDDSATARLALKLALASDPGLEIVGEVARGADVLRAVQRLKPDLVTMDVYLGTENGLDVAGLLMREHALPILVVTATNPTCPDLLYRAMTAGVLEVCAKLPSATSPAYLARRQELVRLVRALARVPVVHRRNSGYPSARSSMPPSAPPSAHPSVAPSAPPSGRPSVPSSAPPMLEPSRAGRLLLIGASTGGPGLVRDLLRDAPRRLPLPAVVAQHMAGGFVAGFRDWLASECRRPVLMVEAPTHPEGNVIYLAPEGRHLALRGGVLVPVDLADAIHTPSIDHLMTSVARDCKPGTVAVLLTGMGHDGAAGLLALSRAGATTIAQEPSTCVVDSMPRAAIACGAARHVLAPKEIGALLATRCAW